MEYEKVVLALYNGEEKEFDVNIEEDTNGIKFNTSEYLNDGMYIDDLEKGIYYLFLRFDYKDEEKEDNIISKYYVLNNDTSYDSLVYYTISKYNHKIVISKDEEYGTFFFNVDDNSDKNIYDVTIDPGHGGMDSGAVLGEYKESEIAMDISLGVKNYLEKNGYTAKLTHDKNDIAKDEVMDKYNKHGRAVIPNEVKSKYTFSIHMNKNDYSSVRGVEIYTASGIDYDFAKSIVNSVVNNTKLEYSNNKMYKVGDGVYTHNFTQSEIDSSLSEYDKKGYKRYNVTSNSNYLYMIRETGGYMTGAYVDDSNPDDVGVNHYYNSNVGNESYLIEVAYLSNTGNLGILNNDKEAIIQAIGEAIAKELDNDK